MSKSLLALTAEVAEIERKILENNGELTPEIEQMLDLSSGDLRAKVDAYKVILDAFEWRSAQFKSIKDQSAAAQKTFDNLRDRLKDNLKYCAKQIGTDDLRGNDWRFKISTSKPRVVYDDTPIPTYFCKEKVEYVPDRDAIESALRLGENVPGAALEQSESIRVYVNNEPKYVKGDKS